MYYLTLNNMYLGIEPEIDDWIGTDRSLRHHCWYGEDIEGEVSVGFVASHLRYRGAGIGEPTEHGGTQLNISPVHDCLEHTLECYHHSNHDCQSPIPV